MKKFLAHILLFCGVAYADDRFIFNTAGGTQDGNLNSEFVPPEPAPPRHVDTDRDGKPDAVDPCPNDPQDKCNDPPPPPADRDSDGIPDGSDTCPDDATNTCHDGPPDVHPDDPDKHAEHTAALALVPIAEASHTLSTGVMPTLPDGARVYIPDGVTVTVDREHVERIRWIRVNGTLRFARDVQNSLKCDTCVVDVLGWLDFGTEDSRRTSPMTWTFIDNGPVSDPMQLGRGIVCHGRFDSVCADGVEVTLRSENIERLHRGHVMQMHAPAMNLEGLRIIHCGRSDKSEPITDFPNVYNLRARYPLHAHRCGLTIPMHWRRVTVEHSPGWGIVNHSSYVLCDDSVCRATYGAGFVGEIGDERGRFRNFVAEDIPGEGSSDLTDGTRGGRAVSDWGFNGHGVWLQGGGNITIEGGVIRHTAGTGLVVMGIDLVFVNLIDLSDAFPALRTAGSLYPWGDKVLSNDIPVRICSVEISECGDGQGMLLWANCNPSHQQVERAKVEDCTLRGVKLINGYSNNCDYIRLNGVGGVTPLSGCFFGHTGVVFSNNLIDSAITGWEMGYQAPTDGDNLISGNTFANVIDIFVTNKTQPARPPGRTLTIVGNTHLPLAANPTQHWPTFNGPIPDPGRYHVYLFPGFIWFDIRNTEQLSDWWPNLFNAKDTFFAPDTITVNGWRLAYREWARDFPLPRMIPQAIREKHATSGELFDATGAALFQRVPVVGVSGEFIRGRFVDEPVQVLELPVVPKE